MEKLYIIWKLYDYDLFKQQDTVACYVSMFGTAVLDFQQVMMSGILAQEYCLWNTGLSGMRFAKFF